MATVHGPDASEMRPLEDIQFSARLDWINAGERGLTIHSGVGHAGDGSYAEFYERLRLGAYVD